MHKENRLTRREDFTKVYRYGKSAANHQFVVYYMAQPSKVEGTEFRLGISVSKKIGNAVVRNRMRRMIKEIIRLNANRMPERMDIVVIARKPAVDLEYAEMEKSLFHALKRANIVKAAPPQTNR